MATGGQYSCSITGTGGCNDTKLVNVIINSQPLPTVISPQIFCIQENATLNNISISGQNIKWYDSNDAILANSTALQNGLFYYASQTIDGCESERIPVLINILDVTSSDCATSSEEFSYPKFFTPNGDGHNDTWNIQFSDLEKNTTVKIFDRYGKLLKELGYNSNGWDGSYTGQELPATDYWFVVTRENGKEYKGHFSLKR
jgi:gliding motility-associated-like protein